MRFNDTSHNVFPGTPNIEDGMLWVNEAPGLGIDIDETMAGKHPVTDDPPFDMWWGELRDRDGTIRRP